MTIWRGEGANATELATATAIAHGVLKGERAVELIDEGSEPSAFWDAIGGRGQYQTATHTHRPPV